MFIDAIGNITRHDKCITLTVDEVTVFDPPMSVLPEASAWGEVKTNVKGRPYRSTTRRFRWEFDHISPDGKGTLVKVGECPACDSMALFDASAAPLPAAQPEQTVAI